MRWFVDISPLGANEGQKLKWCIEAAGWQAALKDARALRGEEGPLGGFSIELLDDGARAVDPVARIRYVIREAPAASALTHTKDGPVNAAPKAEPASTAAPTRPEAAAAATQPATAAPSASATSTQPAAPTPPAAAPTPPAAAPAPPAAPAQPATPAAAPDDDADIPVDEDEAPAETVPASLPSFELLQSREEGPSATSPLTYREHVYVVDPATSDADVERLLHARFQVVRDSIAGAKPGRFVNLAIFDHTFTGRPSRRPRATLAWKDWRGTPEIRFPTSERASLSPPSFAAPTSLSQPVPQPSVPPPHASTPPPSASRGASLPPTEPVPTPMASTEPAPAPLSLSQRPTEPAPVPVSLGQRPTEPAPVLASAAPKTKPAATSAPRAAHIPAVKTATEAGKRTAADELIGELFEACGDLQFARDSLEGADFVLGLAIEKLPCEVGLVSLFDINRREFVVVRQAGGQRSIVLSRLSERAGLAQTAMRKRSALVVPDASADARALDDRFRALGIELRSMIVAPVEQGGRYLGLIELVNPVDGRPFSEAEGHALTYIGEQYAEFVAGRGVQLDPTLVIERHQKR